MTVIISLFLVILAASGILFLLEIANPSAFIEAKAKEGSFQTFSLTSDPCPEGYALSQSSSKCEIKQGFAISERSGILTNNGTNANRESIKALFSSGVQAGESGHYNEALWYFDKILAIDPNHENTLTNKGATLIGLGRYQEALEVFDRAIAIDPNDDLLLNKGTALLEVGRYQEAIEYFDKALAIDPDDEDTLYNKGVILVKQEKHQEAIEYFDKALAIDPNDKQTLKNKGTALGNLGRHQEAIEYFDKALAIDPNYKKATDAKEHVLAQLKKNKEVFIQTNPPQSGSNQSISFQNADPCPTGFALSQSSGKCEINQGFAIQEQQSPSLNGNTTAVNLARAAELFKLERYQGAIENVDKVLAVDPNNKKALTLKATTLFKLEREQEALEYFDKALAIDSNDKFSLTYKGLALNNLERYQEAMKYYDKALAIDPSYDTALAGKGISLINIDLYQEAIVFLDKALAIDPDDKDALQAKKKVLEYLKGNNDNGSVFITYSNKEQDLVSYRIPNDWKQSKQTLSGDRGDHIAAFNHKEAVGSNLDLQITVYMAVELEFKGKEYDGYNTDLRETAELAVGLLGSEYNDIKITNVNTMKIDGYDAAVFSATGTDNSGSNKGSETSIMMVITISGEDIYIFRYESNNAQAFQQHLSDFESVLKSVDFKTGGQEFGGFGGQGRGFGGQSQVSGGDDNGNG